MKIATIRIGERHRKDLGDLQPLADSITEQGLLQPVGVTATGELVFGERRLKACQLLGWTEISTRIVNVTSIADGEYAENEMRKDFTASERVAIAKAVAAEIGNRQGERTELPDNRREVPQGAETQEIAAERAGFTSEIAYRRAKRVVERGAPEVVEAMDRGDMAISTAAAVAMLPPAEQVQVLSEPKALTEVIRRANGRKPADPSPIRNIQKAKPSTKRLDNALTSLRSVADTLPALDIRECHSAPVAQRRQWVEEIDQCLNAIRAFRRRLAAAAVA